MADTPNPERRSDAALLCLGIGCGLVALSWFLGLGGVIAAVASGSAPATVAGSIAGLIVLVLGASAGGILALVGVVWIFVRVIADSREANAKERYSRDVQR